LFEVDRQIDPERVKVLTSTLAATLADVRVAVADWRPMLDQARAAARELNSPGVPRESDAAEAQALIEWMVEGHFTFLGYRRYRLRRGARQDLLVPQDQTGLGILRASRPGIATPSPTALTGALRREARSARAVLVTKANSRATRCIAAATWTTSVCAPSMRAAESPANCAFWDCGHPRPTKAVRGRSQC